MMTDQELIQKLQSLRSIKPSRDWLSKSERELRAQMPKSQWPIYSVVFVLALGLSFGFYSSSPKNEQSFISPELIQEQGAATQAQAQVAKEQVKATVQKAKTAAKKIEQVIEAKVQAIKINSSQEDQLDPRVKLLEDLEKAKATSAALTEIEKYIEEGDYVVAREKLNQLLKNLDSLKVDSEKEEITINQDNN